MTWVMKMIAVIMIIIMIFIIMTMTNIKYFGLPFLTLIIILFVIFSSMCFISPYLPFSFFLLVISFEHLSIHMYFFSFIYQYSYSYKGSLTILSIPFPFYYISPSSFKYYFVQTSLLTACLDCPLSIILPFFLLHLSRHISCLSFPCFQSCMSLSA